MNTPTSKTDIESKITSINRDASMRTTWLEMCGFQIETKQSAKKKERSKGRGEVVRGNRD
jgi:hypothetical protein